MTILFKDEFTGTVLDTSRWALAEENQINCSITQNDKAILNYLAGGFTGNLSTSITSLSTYATPSSLKVCSFDLQSDIPNLSSFYYFVGVTGDATVPTDQNFIRVNRSTTAGSVQLGVKQGGSLVSQTAALDITTTQTIKILIGTTTVDFYYWDGSWTQLGTQFGFSSTWDIKSAIAGHNSGATGLTVNVDNYVLTDEDFSTQYPVDGPATTTVEVEWIDSESAAATGNKIYRDTVPSTGEVEIADIANGIQIYQDATAETGTEYKYEVQAYSATDETTQEVLGVNVQYITTA